MHKKLMIPNNWQDIEVNQFIELRGLSTAPSSSITERYIDLLLTVSDIELEVIEDMSLDELTDHVNTLKWLRKEPHKKFAKSIGDYSIMDFKKVTWGMFIDLEYYYANDYIKNMCIICGILYRKQKDDEWGNNKIEPYRYDPKIRAKTFESLPITSIYGVVSSYLDFRDSLINGGYKNLFESPIEEDEEELTPEDRKEIEKEQKFNKWAYESVTLGLANGDITKMKDILDMPLIYVLNMLSMKKEIE